MLRKVGDKVRVREDLIENEKYGALLFITEMKIHKGQEFIIEELNSNGYGFHGINWCWSDEMLDNVTEEILKVDYDKLAKVIKPTGFESMDERFSIEIDGENSLRLIAYEIENNRLTNQESITIYSKDLDTLIDLLTNAKNIETRTWNNIKKETL